MEGGKGRAEERSGGEREEKPRPEGGKGKPTKERWGKRRIGERIAPGCGVELGLAYV